MQCQVLQTKICHFCRIVEGQSLQCGTFYDLFGELEMTQHYFNPNFRDQEITQSGPYVFKFGVIVVDESAKKTVGPILTNFYGCKEISAKQAATHLKKAAADSQEAQAAAEEAERQEAEAKEAAAKEAAAKEAAAKEAAEKAAAEAEATSSETKPEDKM